MSVVIIKYLLHMDLYGNMKYEGKYYDDKVIIKYMKRKLYRTGCGASLNELSDLYLVVDEEDNKIDLMGKGDGTKVAFEFSLNEILQHILNKKLKKIKNA